MAKIKIKGRENIVVTDDIARKIKDDWFLMKEGKLPKEMVIELGDFTGELGQVESFIIEKPTQYDQIEKLPEYTSVDKVRIAKKITDMKEYLAKIVESKRFK